MKKKRCQTCKHMHKRSAGKGKSRRGQTNGWECMKSGCSCGSFRVAGALL